MSNSIGLYIHIPFCKNKCPYCDFFSNKANESDFNNYVHELCKKIEYWGNKNNKTVKSVYFGGGTPSVINANRLCYLLNKIKQSFKILSDAEITAEINPESGKTIDFDLMRYNGFNRLSVGMQTSNENELKLIGRIHNTDDVKITIANAKKSGFKNISLDLMMGIPNQTIESLEKSIEFCVNLDVTHISSYILKIENNTPFYKIKDSLVLADDDMQAEMYLRAVDLLENFGYKQYEISNFAKPDFESVHNINYWQCGEYIGIGPSAHSFYNGERFFYSKSIENFIDNKIISDGKGGTEEEYIMLALRLKEGLVFNNFESRFNKKISKNLIDKAKFYEKYGYIDINNESVSLTAKGFLVSNSIIGELI